MLLLYRLDRNVQGKFKLTNHTVMPSCHGSCNVVPGSTSSLEVPFHPHSLSFDKPTWTLLYKLSLKGTGLSYGVVSWSMLLVLVACPLLQKFTSSAHTCDSRVCLCFPCVEDRQLWHASAVIGRCGLWTVYATGSWVR